MVFKKIMAPEGLAALLRALNQLCYFVCFFVLFVTYFVYNVADTVSYVAQQSKALYLNARGVTTDPGCIQAVSHPAVIGSPIGQRTIGPASSGFGRGRPSL
jgi:hypothetical protein